jgi:hypothetical protein
MRQDLMLLAMQHERLHVPNWRPILKPTSKRFNAERQARAKGLDP